MKKLGNYYISSKATINDFMKTLTEETEGNCLLVAEDYDPQEIEKLKAELFSEINNFEEMSKEGENERISHLAEEREIDEEELDYLR